MGLLYDDTPRVLTQLLGLVYDSAAKHDDHDHHTDDRKIYLHKAELRCDVGERLLLAEDADGYTCVVTYHLRLGPRCRRRDQEVVAVHHVVDGRELRWRFRSFYADDRQPVFA